MKEKQINAEKEPVDEEEIIDEISNRRPIIGEGSVKERQMYFIEIMFTLSWIYFVCS